MKKITLFLITFWFFSNAQKNITYKSDFNNDGVKDVLYIKTINTDGEKSGISKRNLLVQLGDSKKKYRTVINNNDIIPCIECTGKSDNYASKINFKNNLLYFSMCNFPFEADYYYISTYKLRLKNENLYLEGYDEVFYKNASDDSPIKIHLEKKDLISQKFNFYNFNFANNDWEDHILISQNNVEKFNNFANCLYEKEQYFLSSKLLLSIVKKFPQRTVAYLNLGDAYWDSGSKEKAKENYNKYISLMKSQRKDLKKISKRVYERTK